MKRVSLVIIFVCILISCYNVDLRKRTDVYLIGSLGKTVENGAEARDVAYCWVNGKPISLTDTVINAYTSGIVISSDSTVYIAGVLAKADDYDFHNDPTAVYWKNGKIDTLVYGNYTGNIILSGNDTYIAGSGVVPSHSANTIAMYWKNSQAFPVADGNTQSGAVGVATSRNNDVYMVGYTINSNGRSGAACWKNGQLVAFAGAIDYTSIKLIDIVISDDDVYIVGNVINKYGVIYAACWKNNKIVLEDSTNSDGVKKTFATGITVSGKDVYVSGGMVGAVVYWKNGGLNIVESIENKNISDAETYNLVVFDGDVYISGIMTPFEQWGAGYWKNGQWFSVSHFSPYAKIFVR